MENGIFKNFIMMQERRALKQPVWLDSEHVFCIISFPRSCQLLDTAFIHLATLLILSLI